MLSITGVRVAYGERVVLAGVDLAVDAGKVIGLVGPNGCGKTTLLRAVTRVVPMLSGRISLDGADVRSLSARDLARAIAVVPQGVSLPLGYTAAEVVLMGRTPHLGFLEQEGPGDYQRACEALSRVGAVHLFDRRVDELSGGERQNVVIARALAQEPRVLLLDEPTASLDIGHQMSVGHLMRRLAREGGLAVLATLHDLTLASLYCDRIALMTRGRVVAEGSPTEVLTEANIREAYDAVARVMTEQASGRPIVLPWDGSASLTPKPSGPAEEARAGRTATGA
jgi:iron complex transport system ATP-binding protein